MKKKCIFTFLEVLDVILCTKLVVDDCADEGVESNIALAFACCGVDGCFRVGLRAIFSEELGLEASLPASEFLEEFGACLLGVAQSTDESVGFVGGYAEAFLVTDFSGCFWVMLVVARVHKFVGFLLAFADNFSVLITVLFFAVYCTLAFNGAVKFGDRV